MNPIFAEEEAGTQFSHQHPQSLFDSIKQTSLTNPERVVSSKLHVLSWTLLHPLIAQPEDWMRLKEGPDSGNDFDVQDNNHRMVGPRSCTHTGHKCPRPYTSSTAFPRVEIRPSKWNPVDRGRIQHPNSNIRALRVGQTRSKKIQLLLLLLLLLLLPLLRLLLY